MEMSGSFLVRDHWQIRNVFSLRQFKTPLKLDIYLGSKSTTIRNSVENVLELTELRDVNVYYIYLN